MKPYRTHSKYTYAMCIYGILFISAFLPALLAIKNIKISPDSMIYALISQEILSGNGLRLPIIYELSDHYVFTNGSAPFPGKPPLLPILFALLGGVTPQRFLAAQIINVISHVAVSIFTFLIMKKLYDNKGIALSAAIIVSISFPLLWNTHQILSESLFIALTVAMMYFLILSRQHPDNHKAIRYFFVASMFTSAAILTRYAGLSLLPAFLWGAFILIKNKKLKLKCVATILTALLPIITTGLLFFRNYIISGTIQGWVPPSPERSYLSAFTGTIKMILLQFNLSARLVTLIMIVVMLFILYCLANSNMRRELSKYIHSGLDLIVVLIISHVALISYSMAKSQTVFEPRYMSSLVPFLFILCIITIIAVGEIIKSKGLHKTATCGIILSLGIITVGNCYKTYSQSSTFSSSKEEGHYRILNSPTYDWIKKTYGKDIIITTNRPFHISFFGGYSTIRLPHKRFEINSWVPDNMESYLRVRMSHFGSRILALFEQTDEQYEGRYISGLFNKSGDDENFVLIHKFSDGVVYELKE